MGVSCLGCTIPVVPTAAWGPASLTTGKIQREPTHLIAGRWHRSPKSRLAQFSAGSQIRAGFHLSSFIVSANSRMLSALPPDENNFCTALLIPASGWLTKKNAAMIFFTGTPHRGSWHCCICCGRICSTPASLSRDSYHGCGRLGIRRFRASALVESSCFLSIPGHCMKFGAWDLGKL